jgi:hypothetical protein
VERWPIRLFFYPHQRQVSGRRSWEPGWGRSGRRLETAGWRKGRGRFCGKMAHPARNPAFGVEKVELTAEAPKEGCLPVLAGVIYFSMKTDILKQYVTLRKSLEEERATLQARLKDIEAALDGGGVPVAAKRRGPGRPKGSETLMGVAAVGDVEAPRRKFKRSAAARKTMAAAQKARRAKINAEKAGEPVAKPKGRTMTPAALKALAKAREIRLAKLKAAKTKQ